MPITSTNTFTLTTIQRLVIDCRHWQAEQDQHGQYHDLIGWVKENERRSSIHVTLKCATGNGIGRKLRGTFQALGCTVSIQTRI